MREHELPYKVIIWLISELEAFTKKHSKLFSWLAKIGVEKDTKVFRMLPQF